MTTGKNHHLSVCICTYKRPDLLARLVSKLETQETEDLFEYSIVIVDNDEGESARTIVEGLALRSRMALTYGVEPEQNIARARNKAIENATGDFIAFIDDDEFPDARWLLELYKCINRLGVDGVLGPVLPVFEEKPPGWVLKGRFFERPTHSTGHVLAWEHTRTGNVLLKRTLLSEDREWFDPVFGSGGEDRDFFRRKIKAGGTFVWCEEARVFESVPAKRWRRIVLLKRALLRGKTAYEAHAQGRPDLLKSAAAIAIYTSILPLCLMLGQHVFMMFLIRECDHLGKVLAFFGIDWVGEKYVGG